MVELRPARLTHIGPIATRLREADRIECAALGRTPKQALRIGLIASLNPITVLIDGRPEAMMGVMPTSMMSGSGVVWMLGTEALYDHKRAFLALGPHVVDAMLDDFRRLENIVSADNARAIRFLRWLGFIVGGNAEMHSGVAFVPFHKSRDSSH